MLLHNPFWSRLNLLCMVQLGQFHFPSPWSKTQIHTCRLSCNFQVFALLYFGLSCFLSSESLKGHFFLKILIYACVRTKLDHAIVHKPLSVSQWTQNIWTTNPARSRLSHPLHPLGPSFSSSSSFSLCHFLLQAAQTNSKCQSLIFFFFAPYNHSKNIIS